MKMKQKMNMEAEHTKSKVGQKKIVEEHEVEHGIEYYPALKKMEAKLPKKESNKMAAKKSTSKWIQSAIKKPGALRKSLGVKKDEKIPAEKLEKAAEKGGKLGQRARLAQTLSKLRKGK